MSWIVKGAEIPNGCCHCPCSDSYGCVVTGRVMATKEMAGLRENISNCPIRPLPKNHGRLIDADALMAEWKDVLSTNGISPMFAMVVEGCIRDVERAKIIVEAEGENDN